jgi:hypothetical protein
MRRSAGTPVSFGLLLAGCVHERMAKDARAYDALSARRVPSMRIKGQADIDIFISDSGYICLKQKDELQGDERVIEFAPAYGQKVAGAISSLQEFAQAKFEKAVVEE